MWAALMLALAPLLQDPPPQHPPQDPPPAEQPPPTDHGEAGQESEGGAGEPDGEAGQDEAGPTLEEVLAEVDRLADLVREGFRKVDVGLQEARDRVDEPDAQADDFTNRLGVTAADADQLLADMEELLETIPELKSDSQSSGGGGQSSSEPEEAQNQDASGEQRDQEVPQPGDGEEEGPEGEGAPKNSYLRLLFDQNAGAWGMLPPRLQEALENAVIEDVPLRYRRWLDEFHRQ